MCNSIGFLWSLPRSSYNINSGFIFSCRRIARELDPSLPVDQALHSIETGVERLAKLVEKKVRLPPFCPQRLTPYPTANNMSH